METVYGKDTMFYGEDIGVILEGSVDGMQVDKVLRKGRRSARLLLKNGYEVSTNIVNGGGIGLDLKEVLVSFGLQGTVIVRDKLLLAYLSSRIKF